jgi:hypothetical protein
MLQKPLAILLILAGLSGCGDSRQSGQVTGRVTMNGEPIAELGVTFQPAGFKPTKAGKGHEDRIGSGATTDANGEFTLKFFDTGKPGVLVGEHTVMITATNLSEEESDKIFVHQKTNPDGTIEETPRGKILSSVPPKWLDGSVTFTVEEGLNEVDFELNE